MLSLEKRRTRAGTLPGLIWEVSPLTGCDRGLLDGESGEPFAISVFDAGDFVVFALSSFATANVVASELVVPENCCITLRSTIHTPMFSQ